MLFRVDRKGRTHGLGKLKAVGIQIGDYHVASAGVLGNCRGHQSDGSGTGNQDVLAKALEVQGGVDGVSERVEDRCNIAIDAVIVLKGPATLIVDRTQHAHNDTGNPGMATAGTGDVLTGVTAALVAQRLSPFDAARLAVWVHGRAGDLAAESLGEISMTARDLLERLHVAFRDVSC